MSRLEHASILALTLSLPLFAGGCSTTAASANGDAGGKDAEQEADALRDKRREVEHKQLELRIARLDADHELANAREDLAAAARTLGEAKQALDLFREQERALALGDAEHDLAGTRQRLVEERADLEQVEKAYADDDYADGVEEIVLARHRARLALVERGFAIQEQQVALLSEHGLPKKERELVDELRQAERAQREAEHALAHHKLASKLALLRLEQELDDLRDELSELEPAGGVPRSAIDESDGADAPLEPREPEPPETLTEGT